MARTGLFFVLAGAMLGAQQVPSAPAPAPTGRGGAQDEAAVVSPEVGANRRVTFRLRAQAARTVAVTNLAVSPSQGAMGLGITLPMRKNGDVWTATSDPLTPDIYSYQFSVDGQTLNDPANPHFIVEFAGDRTSTFSVPGALWTSAGAPAGMLTRHSYTSAAIGGAEEYDVYTPPGYDAKRAEPYPVFYLLHGQGDGTQTWVTNGGVDITLNNLIAQGKARPMVLVMPLGYGSPDGLVRFENFERALLEEVIPQVERAHNVSRDRTARAIAGVSVGGAQAVSIGLRHDGAFGWIGSFSGALQMLALAGPSALSDPMR